MNFKHKLQLYIIPIVIIPTFIVTLFFINNSRKSINDLQYENMNYKLEVIHQLCDVKYDTLERVNLDEVVLYVEKAKQEIYSFINETEVVGGYFYIVDSQNNLIFTSSNGNNDLVIPANIAMIHSENLAKPVNYLSNSEEYIAFITYFEKWDWFVVSTVKSDVIYSKVSESALFALYSGAIAIVVAVLLLVLISKGITKPVEILATGTKAMKKGAYDTRVIVNTNDEFGMLAETFNGMAEEIETNFDQMRIQSENLSLLASFAAEMSHDVNTPIGNSLTVSTYLDLELKELGKSFLEGTLNKSELETYIDDTKESVDILTRNMVHASELITSFKTVSIDQLNRQKRTIDLSDYISQILKTLRPKLKKLKHQIIVSCSEKIIINSYPGAISQIITNLIMNSVIHGFEDMDAGVININISKSADEVQIDYRDNGKGITKENLEKLYEKFFTTKPESGGSGLGMHIVYSLVNTLLGGKIDAYSELGNGVEFKISFPINE